MKLMLFALLAMGFSGSAVAREVDCSQQDQALQNAEAVYAKDTTPAKTFLHTFGGNGTVSLHRAQLESAQQAMRDCLAKASREEQDQEEQAKIDAYNARPEVVARYRAIARANDPVNGRVNVETFTPTEWLRGVGLTPWIALGKTESKAFFYTFGSKDYQTYINIKTATLGAGDEYILMEFVTGQLDCRPGHGYPPSLPMPTTYSYAATGRPMLDDFTNPPGVEIPIEHGSVLAAAVIGTCDAVRAHHGTVNYPG